MSRSARLFRCGRCRGHGAHGSTPGAATGETRSRKRHRRGRIVVGTGTPSSRPQQRGESKAGVSGPALRLSPASDRRIHGRPEPRTRRRTASGRCCSRLPLEQDAVRLLCNAAAGVIDSRETTPDEAAEHHSGRRCRQEMRHAGHSRPLHGFPRRPKRHAGWTRRRRSERPTGSPLGTSVEREMMARAIDGKGSW